MDRTRSLSSPLCWVTLNAMALRKTTPLSVSIATNTTKSPRCTTCFSSALSSRVNFPQLSKSSRPRRREELRGDPTLAVARKGPPETKKDPRVATGTMKKVRLAHPAGSATRREASKVQVYLQKDAIAEKTSPSSKRWSTGRACPARVTQRQTRINSTTQTTQTTKTKTKIKIAVNGPGPPTWTPSTENLF